jgi:chromosome segregation ATPase
MDLSSELDRLESCVKRAFERIDTLQDEKNRLADEKLQLENRLKDLPASNPAPAAPVISSDRLGEVRTRLTKLIEQIKTYEGQL